MLDEVWSPGAGVLLAAVSRQDAVPLAVAGAISLGAWLVLAAVVLAATRPKLPPAGPATMELGPEPPAVANLLVHRCHITATAVSATLLDLAARRFLDIDQVAPDTFLCRLFAHRSDKGAVTPYEAKVLDLVQQKAAEDGTVAARELSLGPGKQSASWWDSFSNQVLDDARDRGLVRRRWSAPVAIGLSAGLLVPFFLGGLALEVLSGVNRAEGSTADGDDLGGGLAVAGFVWLLVVFVAGKKLRAWRETTSGRTATAHWLGFRHQVRKTELLMSAPPAAVVIWGRNLSYGVALGGCPEAALSLPIGPQRDDEAWSAYGGRWREVSISYPRRFYEGEAPARAALLGFGWLALSGLVGAVIVPTMGPILWDLLGTVTEAGNVWLRLAVFAAAFLGLGIPFIWAGSKMVKAIGTLSRALPDLGSSPATFEGQVLRVPWRWVTEGDSTRWAPSGFTAVDPGTGDEIRALRFYRPEVDEGDVVRVTVTRHLRHVSACEVLDAATAARRWQTRRPTAAPGGPTG